MRQLWFRVRSARTVGLCGGCVVGARGGCLTGLDDESVAMQAARDGAQDFLVKGEVDGNLLVRSIRYSLARHRAKRKLKRALELAQANEEKFRDLFENTSDLIQSVAPDGSFLFVNPAWKKTLGYTDEDLAGLNLFDMIHPGSQGHCREMFQRILAGETLENLEVTFVTRDGRPIQVEGSSSCRFENGKPVATRGTFHDITMRKLAEVERIKRLEAERDLRVREREISIARHLQQSLFPTRGPTLAGYDISGDVFLAEHASGDYFDFIPMAEGSIGVVVADVSGHGLGPALLMARTQAFLRALAETHVDPGEILTRANRLLANKDAGYFVSMFFARVDPRKRSFVYASAGHPGYLLHGGGEVTLLASTDVPLCVIEDQRISCAAEPTLEPGDLVLLPTDGILEVRSPAGTLFGIERTVDVLRANRERPAREIVQTLYRAARDFAQGAVQHDDMAAVVIKAVENQTSAFF